MSSRAGGSAGGAKRKHSTLGSSSGSSGSRAQQKKLASKAAKRGSAAAAAQRGPSAAEERHTADALFFESDEDDDRSASRGKKSRGDDLLIRDPRRGGGGGGDDFDQDEDDDEYDGARGDHAPAPPVDPYAHETADEARARLGRAFLTSVEMGVDAELAAADGDEEQDGDIDAEARAEEDEEERRGITRDAAIDRKLKETLLAQQGKLKAVVAHARYDRSTFPASDTSAYLRVLPGHSFGGATCIAMPEDCSRLYTGGKDCNLIAWDTETGQKVHTFFGNRGGKYANVPGNAQGHTAGILACSVSSDGQFLASGSMDSTVKIWDPRIGGGVNGACVKTFAGGHKGPVSGVAFRLGSHTLFTGSTDRTIRMYNLDQFAFVETLYGHTAPVTCLDALYKDRCLSVSQDKTARLWKIVEETQVLFRGSTFAESLDCVAMLNEEAFLTGGQDGTVCAWNTGKKKPTSVVTEAHAGGWISSVGAQRFTDVCFSGSRDGFLNLYCLESAGRLTNKLTSLSRIPVQGWVNGMVSDARHGRFVACAVGKEHRQGRWDTVEQAKSGVVLVSLAGVEQEKQVREEAMEGMEREDEPAAGRGRRANGHGRAAEEDDDDDEEPRFGVSGGVAAAAAAAPSRGDGADSRRSSFSGGRGGGGRGGGRGGARGGARGGGRGGSSRGGGGGRGGRGGRGGGGRGRGR